MKSILNNILSDFGHNNRIFHSEAELQFCIAWELKNRNRDIDVWFEYPAEQIKNEHKRIPQIDLVIQNNNLLFPIEIKYAKGNLSYKNINLSNKPLDECFDVAKDIKRLEDFSEKYDNFDKGYVIVVSNNFSWFKDHRPSSKVFTYDSYLLDHDSNILTGMIKYKIDDNHKSQQIIELKGKYDTKWQEYCSLGNNINEIFKYLIIEISKA